MGGWSDGRDWRSSRRWGHRSVVAKGKTRRRWRQAMINMALYLARHRQGTCQLTPGLSRTPVHSRCSTYLISPCSCGIFSNALIGICLQRRSASGSASVSSVDVQTLRGQKLISRSICISLNGRDAARASIQGTASIARTVITRENL